MSPNLERAIVLAVEQHAGQMDKQGLPFILHILRVVGRLAFHPRCSEDALIVAALHDLKEDTPYDGDLDWLSREALAALDCMTRRSSETYEAYIGRLLPNDVARLVKEADILDNMDPARPPVFDTESLRPRYMRALSRISAANHVMAAIASPGITVTSERGVSSPLGVEHR
jgi:hypothetical protein